MKLIPTVQKTSLKNTDVLMSHLQRLGSTNRISEDGEFYPRVVESPTEPVCNVGEMIIWHDTSV